MRNILTALLLANLFACTGLPDKVEPVNDFALTPYLGTWYEIARLDHSFERDLHQVTATYDVASDGSVTVTNKGFDKQDGEWQQAIGTAKFVDSETVGHLKVSFFGPFYSSYVVFYLDSDYQHAFVSGFNHNYLWLLSRTPEISQQLKTQFVAMAKSKGFDTKQLIWVEHTSKPTAKN
ncbi:lipocalin [Thalassotalea sp. HSM 43]|uniref:lipocalin family protein n=1 Tax=Thalassotalea sp. HSM 43 TaxID=2552945 RepID=UPI0010817BAA|nr:lipocalin family protein [Thalassotalea sp. HSM 43]QBY03663.1 lipocalin [Thalassotalea sp. HSM 43]